MRLQASRRRIGWLLKAPTGAAAAKGCYPADGAERTRPESPTGAGTLRVCPRLVHTRACCHHVHMHGRPYAGRRAACGMARRFKV